MNQVMNVTEHNLGNSRENVVYFKRLLRHYPNLFHSYITLFCFEKLFYVFRVHRRAVHSHLNDF